MPAVEQVEEQEQELNAGLVLVAKGQYSAALVQFDDLLEISPASNLLAANNKAICLLYTGKLKAAIAFLEETIRLDVSRNLQNAIVFNLAMMYDLAAHRAKENKRTLQQLAQRYASDDFDQTVLKL
jgi:tetratricopeptide (TPR) repeat protein